MSELMAKALFLIGQGMHGRRAIVRAVNPFSGIGIESSSCRIALLYRDDHIDVSVDGDRIESSDDPEIVAGAAIAHLLGIGTSEET